MASLLIATTTKYTIRQKSNGVIFAQCNVTKKFVKTAVALTELQSELAQVKEMASTVKTITNVATNTIAKHFLNYFLDNFILIMCIMICVVSFGAVVFSWINYDSEIATAYTIMFSCTFFFPFLLANHITDSKQYITS